MIQIKLSPTNLDFANQYQSLLDAYQEETQIFTTNLQNNTTDESLPKVAYRGGVYCDDQLELLFLNANPHNLVLFSEHHHAGAIKVLVQDLIHNQIEIKGILAHKDVCDVFIAEYKNILPAEFILNTAMDIMRLDHLVKPNLIGTLVCADVEETDFILHCMYDFNVECLHEAISYSNLLTRYQERIINHKFYIYYNENHIKTSIVMLSRDLKDGKAITAVYTLPEFRGKGYATSMMYYACEIVFSQGYRYATLFVDQNNPISNRVYQKIGFYILTNAYDYRLK